MVEQTMMLSAALVGIVTCIWWFVEIHEYGWAQYGTPNRNQMTLVFFFVLPFWAALFLERWKRTENVFKFRWGTEAFEEHEKTRRDYDRHHEKIKAYARQLARKKSAGTEKDQSCLWPPQAYEQVSEDVEADDTTPADGPLATDTTDVAAWL